MQNEMKVSRKEQDMPEMQQGIRFEVKMTQKIMYNFLMNHTYRSLSGIMGILFGIAAFVIMGVTYGDVPSWQSGVYLC